MKHLSPAQLVDVVEGTAGDTLTAHCAGCPACRTKADELRATLAVTSANEVPEPSPLFWDHLSARVARAVRDEPVPGAWWQRWTWQWVPLSAAAMVLIAVGFGVSWRGISIVASHPASELALGPAVPLDGIERLDAGESSDVSWTLMTDLSSTVAADETLGAELPVLPDAADRALHHLTEPEQAELIRILHEEMGPSARMAPRPARK
ncbi:MAG: hypothetical protein NTY02_16555 [Acidobacteria bacterium]|nr:hypothetical protein [Acidobacteriota bacterium]